MLTREQRLKEREVKRILHEEELAKLEELKNTDSQDARVSERNLKNEMERRQKELERLAEEEDRWIFDCSVCGIHGENVDDGTHSIACERCNIWQHSKCHGIRIADAERDDFHFICTDCIRKEEDAKKPKIRPLKLGRIGSSSSPQTDRLDNRPTSSSTNKDVDGEPHGRIIEGVSIYRPAQSEGSPLPRPYPDLMNGPSLSPSGQSPGPPGYRHTGPPTVGVPQPIWQGNALPPPQRPVSSGTGSPPPVLHGSPNGHFRSPSFQLHQQAHASAVSSSNVPHNPPGHYVNGHTNGVNGSMPPPSPHASRPVSSHGPLFNSQRQLSATPSNGVQISPRKAQPSVSPSQRTPHLANNTPLGQFLPPSRSPNTSFPPPSQHEQQQRAAGFSPVKQPSSSPLHQPPPLYSQSPSGNPPVATPSTQAMSAFATPMASIRATPSMASSPIPPLGAGPVIPKKHDTPRPISRDSIGETPVFPPAMALSPTATENGRGMGVEGGEGGLGVGDVPVKKMPEHALGSQDAFMRDA